MRIPEDLDGARLTMVKSAELFSMTPAHLRRLVRRGVFPAPKRTAKGQPFFNYDLLCQIGNVLKSGVGVSGEEILFYRRRPKKRQQPDQRPVQSYLATIIDGCRQLGVTDNLLDPARIKAALRTEFGTTRPDLDQAIPAVARRLLGGTS